MDEKENTQLVILLQECLDKLKPLIKNKNPMDVIPCETIWSNDELVVPMADVQHIEKKYYSQDMVNPDVKKGDLMGLLVVMKSTRWNMEQDVWDGGVWIDRFKAEDFIKDWCYFRYEIDGIKAQMES